MEEDKKHYQNSEKEKKPEIEIVTDDGSNLEISPVYRHLNISKPKSASERPKNVVVPEEIKNRKKKKET